MKPHDFDISHDTNGVAFNKKHKAIQKHVMDIDASVPLSQNKERTPLCDHVYNAVNQYFIELEGQLPTNLYNTILQEVEKPLLRVVLEQTQNNQSKSAKILGLNRGTLRKKMEQYNLF